MKLISDYDIGLVALLQVNKSYVQNNFFKWFKQKYYSMNRIIN